RGEKRCAGKGRYDPGRPRRSRFGPVSYPLAGDPTTKSGSDGEEIPRVPPALASHRRPQRGSRTLLEKSTHHDPVSPPRPAPRGASAVEADAVPHPPHCPYRIAFFTSPIARVIWISRGHASVQLKIVRQRQTPS